MMQAGASSANRVLLRFFVLLGFGLLWGGIPFHTAGATRPEAFESDLDSILIRVVEDGRVDYVLLKADRTPLDRWLSRADSISWSEVNAWPKAAQLAFCLNTYNARVLATVRDHYPIAGSDTLYPRSSIQQIHGVWNLPFRVAGQTTSLTGLERDILWVDFRQSDMHFGLVPASLGGPPARSQAFHGDRCSQELLSAKLAFAQDPRKVKIDENAGVVHLSRMFDWKRKDFLSINAIPPGLQDSHGDLAGALAHLATVLVGGPTDYLLQGAYRIEFLPYDWSLNDRPDSLGGAQDAKVSR